MAQKTDSQLTTEATVIQNETIIGANTALRVGSMLNDLVSNKINNDKISDNTALGSSTTLVPTQNAVKVYVDTVTTGLLIDNGNYDPTVTGLYPTSGNTISGGAVQKGDIWFISVSGTMNGNAVLVGYSVRALINSAGVSTDADWSISNVGIGYVPENVANKSLDVNLGTSDIYYPSQKAVKTYVDAQVLAAVPFTAENVANKVTDITANPSSTILYPSNKAVADYVNLGVSLQTVTENGNTTTLDVHVQNIVSSENATDNGAAYLNNVVGDGGILGIKKADGTSGEIKATNINANRDYELPDASGTLVLSVNGTSPDSAGNVTISSGGGSVSTVKVSLTSADILALAATPFTLIAAQGAGTFINVLKVYFKYNFVTTAYPNGGSLFTALNSYTGFTVSNALANVLSGTVTALARPVISLGAYITPIDYNNTPLLLCVTQTETTGDSTLDVFITYDVITL